MYESLPIPTLLEEWLSWVQWATSPDRDESKSGQFIGFDEMLWVVENEPEKAWTAILAAVADARFQPYLPNLAASVVEDLLGRHGELFIERVEHQAKDDPRFAWLLGGMYQYTMKPDVWRRVQAVWDLRGWDQADTKAP